MTRTISLSEAPVTNSPNARTIRWVAPILGVATAAWLMVYGIVLDTTGPGLLAYLPPALVAFWLMVRKQERSPTWIYAMMPVSIGLVTVMVLVGSYVLTDVVPAFWVAGGLLSALPFLGVARGIRD